MRYLKKFESIYSGYKYISLGEYRKFNMNKNRLSISSKAIDLANLYGDIEINIGTKSIKSVFITPVDKHYPSHFKRGKSKDIRPWVCAEIFEFEDEWFLVSNESDNRYYLCDQLEGLNSCLIDIYGIDKSKSKDTNHRSICTSGEIFESLKEKTYKEIDEDNFDSFDDKSIDISQKAIDLVSKYSDQIETNRIFLEDKSVIVLSIINSIYPIEISENMDEWFIVSIYNKYQKYYLCDQLEGLKDLLDDMLELEDRICTRHTWCKILGKYKLLYADE